MLFSMKDFPSVRKGQKGFIFLSARNTTFGILDYYHGQSRI